jgi:uncharacterized protein with PIN domain
VSPAFRFAVDTSLGKLVRHLRMIGFDARYPDPCGQPFRRVATPDPGRIIVTRTQTIRDRFRQRRVIFICHNDPLRQLAQVIEEVGIQADDMHPFTRCLECNRQTVPISRDTVRGRVPPYVWQSHSQFATCNGCHRIYWAGSHLNRMVRRVSAICTLKKERHHEQ